MKLTATQGRVIFCKYVVCLLASLIAILRALASIAISRRRGHASPIKTFADSMMGILFTIELLLTLLWSVGASLAATANGSAPWSSITPEVADRWCYPVAFGAYWLDNILFVWHGILAHSIWAWVVRRQNISLLTERVKSLFAYTVIFTMALNAAPMLEHNLGLRHDSDCYLRNAWKDGRPTASLILSRIILFPVCWISIVVLNASTILALRRDARFQVLRDKSVNRLQIRLLLITLIFVTIWGLQSVPLWMNHRTYLLELCLKWIAIIGLLDATAFSFNGVNCCRYDASSERRSLGASDWEVTSSVIGSGLAQEDAGNRSYRAFFSLLRRQPRPLSPRPIFATTFDMHRMGLPAGDIGDAHLMQGLQAWLPRGYYVYAIALQRCRMLAKLRGAIHEYLGGPGKYMCLGTAEVGGALTSKLVLLIFARTVDVESGAIRLIASNQRPVGLRTTSGGSRGLVGLGIRYYDQTVAVISAHLPMGRWHTPEKRDQHISAILQSLRLANENELFDSHLQYHHVILLGNLCYGSRLDPDRVLASIVDSSKATQRVLGQHGWRGYGRLWMTQGLDTPDGEGKEQDEEWGRADPMTEGGNEMSSRPDAWAWVDEADFLKQRMRQAAAFYGFSEPRITFPPTFKWRSGVSALDCTVSALVEAAYITKRQNNQSASVTPSYNDRILVRSLPDHTTKLITTAYELCDDGPLSRASDHRPVSQAMTLLLDTTSPAGSWQDNFAPGSSPPLHHEDSDTANAMAAAAARRHSRRRTLGLPPLPLSMTSRPQFSLRPMATRVTLRMRSFSFRFKGFKCLDSSPTTPCPICAEIQSSSDEELVADFVGASEAAAACRDGGRGRGVPHSCGGHNDSGAERDEQGRVPPPPSLHVPPPPPPPSLANARYLPSIDEDAAAMSTTGHPGPKRQSALAHNHVEPARDVGLVQEVLILYPLPCEDQLLSVRRSQAMAHSFYNPTSCRSQSYASRSDNSGRSVREHRLQNVFRVAWRDEFDQAQRGSDEQDRADEICVDVLTLGDSPQQHHALMKFVGVGGKDLGQGVLCLSHAQTPRSIMRLVQSQAGQSWSRQRVELSVGGDHRGSVMLDLCLTTCQRERNGARIRVSTCGQ